MTISLLKAAFEPKKVTRATDFPLGEDADHVTLFDRFAGDQQRT